VSDLLVVGAGVFGLTVAERAAAAGLAVEVIDERSHIGGNAHSHTDSATGVEVHTYGSHIFHTSNPVVWAYVNRFADFAPYRHRVLTTYRGRVYPMPVNLLTLNLVYGRAMRPDEARRQVSIDSAEVAAEQVSSLEQKAVSLVGRPVYEALIKGYTLKQWGISPLLLPASIITRLPVRYTYEDRYFSDRWEALPVGGYTNWIEAIAASKRISISLNRGYDPALHSGVPTVYTGAIDAYFGYRFGALGWRTVDLETRHHECEDYQGCPVMNDADADSEFTRVHEYRHYWADAPHDGTVTHHERSRLARRDETPCYPVNSEGDRAMLLAYRAAAAAEPDVWFGGRLGSYLYLDMHMAIAAALNLWENALRGRFKIR